jgi:hypothetical protein
MNMRKQLFILLLASLAVTVSAGPLQATGFQFTDNIMNGVTLNAGHYDASLDLSGTVWQRKNHDGWGWEPDDQITATAVLDGTVVATNTISGMNGQYVPFNLPLTFSVDAKDQSVLQFAVTKQTSESKEVFKVDSAVLSGDFQPPTIAPVISVPTPNPGTGTGTSDSGSGGAQGGGDVHSVPEPSVPILLGAGILMLFFCRKKLTK